MIRRALGAAALAAALFWLTPAPALAQFQPRRVSIPVSGEIYRIEFSGGIWFPTADITISNTALGHVGTDINFKSDLGLKDKDFPDFDLVFRAARKHKLRVQFIPIKYTQSAIPTRSLVFNGSTYPAGVPITSELNWKAYRFSYEYDFVAGDAGFFGLIAEAKYTDLKASLSSPASAGTSHARVPLPAIGGIARIYLTSHVAITGEVTGIKIPTTNSRSGHYGDYDVYGTLNFTRNVGVVGGYRTFDVEYHVDQDTGSMTLKGNYVNLVIRF